MSKNIKQIPIRELFHFNHDLLLKKNDTIINIGYTCDEKLSNKNLWLYYNNNIKTCLVLVSAIDRKNYNIISTDNCFKLLLNLLETLIYLYNRKIEAKKMMRKIRKKYKQYTFTICGHSLGGSLALHICKKNDILFCINPVIIPFLFDNIFNKKYTKNVTIIRNEYDFSSMLAVFNNNITINTTCLNKNNINIVDIFSKHLLHCAHNLNSQFDNISISI